MNLCEIENLSSFIIQMVRFPIAPLEPNYGNDIELIYNIKCFLNQQATIYCVFPCEVIGYKLWISWNKYNPRDRKQLKA